MSKSPRLADIAALSVAGIAAVQLLTDANPIGRCLLLLKQLRGHVSSTDRTDCLADTTAQHWLPWKPKTFELPVFSQLPWKPHTLALYHDRQGSTNPLSCPLTLTLTTQLTGEALDGLHRRQRRHR